MKIAGAFTDWRLLAVVLAAVIGTCGIVIGMKYHPSSGVEVSVTEGKALQGSIYVGGEVNNPGIYPLFAGDSIEDVLRAAGGIREGAELSDIQLIVSGVGKDTTQKININRAEIWLLEALPGIGEGRARAIIDYRTQHGLFHDIHELTKVPWLGESVFDDIKGLVAVGD
jgi:competence protein ComEA